MTTTNKQVSLGTDDAQENHLGALTLGYTSIQIGVGTTGTVYMMGIRWQDVDIPNNSEVLSAKLSLYLVYDPGSLKAVIHGVDSDDTSTWATGNKPSDQTLTSASVSADEADWNSWAVDSWVDIDISDIIQEITSRSGWASGNDLSIVIADDGGSNDDQIAVRTYEFSSVLAAKLEVVHDIADSDIPAAHLVITDLDGTPHTIMTDISAVTTTTTTTDSTDQFSVDLANTDDQFDYVEVGCRIAIRTGVRRRTTKIDGIITDVDRTLNDGVLPVLRIAGEDAVIRMNNLFISKRFYGEEVSDLAVAILDTVDHTSGETFRTLGDLDASNEFIEATPYMVDEVAYNFKSIASCWKELAERVGFEWFRDTDKKLHFYDPEAAGIAATIVDADLADVPEISNNGEIVNRAIVIGGLQQVTDKEGDAKTTTTTVTSTTAKNQSFVPVEPILSSILIYTEAVTDSESELSISIQQDSGSAPDGINMANGKLSLKGNSIIDAGFSEFRFSSPVTLTSGETYWMVLEGTTADGVKIGVTAAAVVDYTTRYPVRVAVMANDDDSQDRYQNPDGSPGIYTAVFRDVSIEDPEVAEAMAGEMMAPEPKTVISLMVRGDDLKAGDVVQVLLSTVGVATDLTMKILSSTQTLGTKFIYNTLELKEL